MGAIGGVDVDQRGSSAGAAHVHHGPLDAIGGPDADAVAVPNAERPEAAGDAVGHGGELGPGETLALMATDDGEAVGVAAGGAVEQAADGQIEERAAGAARMAEGADGFFNWHVCVFISTESVYQRTVG